jgi:hypothetical protein
LNDRLEPVQHTSATLEADEVISFKFSRHHGFRLDVEHGGEVPHALSAEVLGMAFEDFEHNRGSGQVTTLWELHPATVNLRP